MTNAEYKAWLLAVKPGDIITRWLAGTIPMDLVVGDVTETLIKTGVQDQDFEGWTFDRASGAEIDEELGWGPPPKVTGSFISPFFSAPQPRS